MDELRPLDGPNDSEDDEPIEPDYLTGLSPLKRRFVEEYVKDCNATKAAIRAGYSDNPASAATIGHRLLRIVEIRKAIDKLLDDLSMSTGEVLHRLTQMARGTVEPFIESYGRGFKFDFSSDEALANLHLIKEIGNTQNGPYIKLHDQKDALFKIAQIRGKVASDNGKEDDAAGNNAPIRVVAYIPDNGRRKPPGYVPPVTELPDDQPSE